MVALEERDDGVVNLVGVNVTLILEKDKKEEVILWLLVRI